MEQTEKKGMSKGCMETLIVFGVIMVMAIAAVEYFVFIRISAPATVADSVFGLSFGTTAYLASYVGAGAILITLGIWKIYRACGRNP